jgi:hypothetical protein
MLPWEVPLPGDNVAVQAVCDGPNQAIAKLTPSPTGRNSLSLLAGCSPVCRQNVSFVDDLERLEIGQRELEFFFIRHASHELNPYRRHNQVRVLKLNQVLGPLLHPSACPACQSFAWKIQPMADQHVRVEKTFGHGQSTTLGSVRVPEGN